MQRQKPQQKCKVSLGRTAATMAGMWHITTQLPLANQFPRIWWPTHNFTDTHKVWSTSLTVPMVNDYWLKISCLGIDLKNSQNLQPLRGGQDHWKMKGTRIAGMISDMTLRLKVDEISDYHDQPTSESYLSPITGWYIFNGRTFHTRFTLIYESIQDWVHHTSSKSMTLELSETSGFWGQLHLDFHEVKGAMKAARYWRRWTQLCRILWFIV